MKTMHTGYVFVIVFFLFFETNLSQDLKNKVDSTNAISYEYIVSNTYQSIKIFNTNLELARKLQYVTGEAKALSNLGLAYYLQGKYEKSTENYLKAINIYENQKSYSMLAETYGEYGYQLKRRELSKAVLYMRKAISIAEIWNLDDARKNKLYDNYGVLKEMHNELDSAMYFYSKALKIKRKISDPIAIPYSLNKIAGLKILQKKFSEALFYLKQSDEYRKKETGDFGRSENYMMYGELYSRQGEIDSAISSYKKCLVLSKKLGYKYQIQESYRNLTELYKKKKDYYKALTNFENFEIYKDSVNNFETNSVIARLEIDYEIANKDKTIAENNLLLKQKSLTVYLLIVTGLFLAAVFTWYFRNQKLKNDREKKELELKTQLSKAEMEKKLGEEKLRLSRELHDNIGSQLTFIVSTLDNITFQDKNNPLIEKLKRLSRFGRETLGDLRNTIWAIKQENGDVSQLVYRLNELILRLNADLVAPKMSLINLIEKPIILTSSQLLNIFRIVQEAIQNTLKHAEATGIKIEFNETPNGFSLVIQDNGKGFNVTKLSEGNGLENIKSRCEESSGQFEIESNSLGTTLKCTFTIN